MSVNSILKKRERDSKYDPGGITINHKSFLTILAVLVAAFMIVPAMLPAVDAEVISAPAADETASDGLLGSLPFGMNSDSALALTAGALSTAVLAAADQSTDTVTAKNISTIVIYKSGETCNLSGDYSFTDGGKIVIQSGAMLVIDMSGFSVSTTATAVSEIIDLEAGATVSLNSFKSFTVSEATAIKFAGAFTTATSLIEPSLTTDLIATIDVTMAAGSILTIGTTTVSSPDKASGIQAEIDIPAGLALNILAVISAVDPSTPGEWLTALKQIGAYVVTSTWGTATVKLTESLNLNIVDSSDTAKLTSVGTSMLTLNSLDVADTFCKLNYSENTVLSSTDGDTISTVDTADLSFTATGLAVAIAKIADYDDINSSNVEFYASGTVSSEITANLSTSTDTGSLELKDAKLTATVTALGGTSLTTDKDALTAKVTGSVGSFVLMQKDDEGTAVSSVFVSNAKISASVSLTQWPSVSAVYTLLAGGDAGVLSDFIADGLTCDASIDLGQITVKSENINVQIDKATLGVTAKTYDKTLTASFSLAVAGNVKIDTASVTSIAVNGLTVSADFSVDTSKISDSVVQTFGTAAIKLNLGSATYSNVYSSNSTQFSMNNLSVNATAALTGTSNLSDATADVGITVKLGSFSGGTEKWEDVVAKGSVSDVGAEVELSDVPITDLASVVSGIFKNQDFSDCAKYVDLTKTTASVNSLSTYSNGLTFSYSNLKVTVLSDGTLQLTIGEVKTSGDTTYRDVKTFSMDLKNVVLKNNDDSRTIGSGSATYTDMEGCKATVSFDQAVFAKAEVAGETDMALTSGTLILTGSGYPAWSDMVGCISLSNLISINASYPGDLLVAGGTVKASDDPVYFYNIYVGNGNVTGTYAIADSFIGTFSDAAYSLSFGGCNGCYGVAVIAADKVTVTVLPEPGYSTLSAYVDGAKYTLNSDSTVATVTDMTGYVEINATPKEYAVTLDGTVLATKYKCGEAVELLPAEQTGLTLIKLVDANGKVYGSVSGLVCYIDKMPAQNLVLTSVWVSTVTPSFTETNKLDVDAFTFTVPAVPSGAAAIAFTLANGVKVSIDANCLTEGETVVITFDVWTQGLPSGAVGYQCTAMQDGSNLPVTFTVPTNSISNPVLYHMDDYGRATQVNATVTDGGLQKTTDSFSIYYVASGPSSGSNTMLIIAVVIVVILAAAGAAYYFLKVRKTDA